WPVARDAVEVIFQVPCLHAERLSPLAGGVGVVTAEAGELLLLSIEGVELGLQPATLLVQGKPPVDIRLARVDLPQAYDFTQPFRLFADVARFQHGHRV